MEELHPRALDTSLDEPTLNGMMNNNGGDAITIDDHNDHGQDGQHHLKTVVERNESTLSSSSKQAHEISEEWSVRLTDNPLEFQFQKLESRESTAKLTPAKRTVSWADIESGAALTTVKEFQPDPPRPESPMSDPGSWDEGSGHHCRTCACIIL